MDNTQFVTLFIISFATVFVYLNDSSFKLVNKQLNKYMLQKLLLNWTF